MMKKLLSLSVLFLLFFLLTPQYSVIAGTGGPTFDNPGECVRFCNDYCESEYGEDCSGLTGEERKECNTLTNILVRCCVTECMEEDPGCLTLGDDTEAPEESVVCEIIDEVCNGD